MIDGKTKAEDIPVAQPASRISILAQFAPVGHAMVQHYTLGKCILPIRGLRLVP